MYSNIQIIFSISTTIRLKARQALQSGPEIQKSPRRISAGGRKDLIRFLTNECRAQGSKDLTKQQGLDLKYFFNNNNKDNNNSSNNF